MFAIGHLALGYLIGKTSATTLKVNVNLPLLLTVSILPDIDLALRFFIEHRSITHSIFTMTLLSLPFLLMYKKETIPYIAALFSHSLIGDFLTGGSEIFWPLSSQQYGLDISVTSLSNALVELSLFCIAFAVIFKSNDLRKLIKQKYNWNWILIVPFVATLGPLIQLGFRSRYIDFAIPWPLIIPSIAWLLIMGYCLMSYFLKIRKPIDQRNLCKEH